VVKDSCVEEQTILDALSAVTPDAVKAAEEPKNPIPNSGDYSNPSDTMDSLENIIREHLVCTDSQRTILTLWILHTYTYKASYLTPYLNISSPVEESGKSTCMTILRSFCARPWWAAGVSPSTFKGKIAADHPTVLLDNWHTLFRGTDKQQMTGFLLSGCDRARDFASRNQVYQSSFDTNDGHTFCPKAFAGLEPLPPTLARRSIPIVLQRRKPQQVVKSAIHLLLPQNTRKFTSWMKDWAKKRLDQIANNFEEYESKTPTLPGFSPHQQECSRVLIALADLIGGHWPEKARAALLAIFREQQNRETSVVQLLSDIRDAFAHHHNPERLFTAELLEYLHSLDHRTWYEWNNQGEPITAQALSRLLRKSFEIGPRTLRRKKEKLRGYQQSDFIEHWERYLPVRQAKGGTESNHPNHAASQSLPGPISPNKISPCLNVPVQNPNLEITTHKLKIPPVSQFKTTCEKIWTKSSSLLKQFAAKSVGLFTAIRF
jgi:hypothetical protein